MGNSCNSNTHSVSCGVQCMRNLERNKGCLFTLAPPPRGLLSAGRNTSPVASRASAETAQQEIFALQPLRPRHSGCQVTSLPSNYVNHIQSPHAVSTEEKFLQTTTLASRNTLETPTDLLRPAYCSQGNSGRELGRGGWATIGISIAFSLQSSGAAVNAVDIQARARAGRAWSRSLSLRLLRNLDDKEGVRVSMQGTHSPEASNLLLRLGCSYHALPRFPR